MSFWFKAGIICAIVYLSFSFILCCHHKAWLWRGNPFYVAKFLLILEFQFADENVMFMLSCSLSFHWVSSCWPLCWKAFISCLFILKVILKSQSSPANRVIQSCQYSINCLWKEIIFNICYTMTFGCLDQSASLITSTFLIYFKTWKCFDEWMANYTFFIIILLLSH